MQELDSQDRVHKEFWEALMLIAEIELQEAVKQDELDWARLRGEPIPAKYTIKEAGLHEAIDSDVQMMLAGDHPPCSHTCAMGEILTPLLTLLCMLTHECHSSHESAFADSLHVT